MIRHQVAAEISVQCRFELVRPRFIGLCAELNVLPEFGLQSIHSMELEAVGRRCSLGRVKSAMSELRRRKMPYVVTLIYGLPRQTLRSFRETVAFCMDNQVPVVRAFPLLLLPGTRLSREKERWGMKTDDSSQVVSSHTFTRTDWSKMKRIAESLQ